MKEISVFIKNLKYFRKINKISQQELADVIGINRKMLGTYEEGRAEPSINNYLKICTFFNVNPQRFYSYDLSLDSIEINKNDKNMVTLSKLKKLFEQADKILKSYG